MTILTIMTETTYPFGTHTKKSGSGFVDRNAAAVPLHRDSESHGWMRNTPRLIRESGTVSRKTNPAAPREKK